MGDHHGWRIFGPHQLAAQNFGFDLQIEHHRLAVGRVQAVGFQQRFEQFFGVGQNGARRMTFQQADMHAGKRHPGDGRGGFVSEGFEKQFFAGQAGSVRMSMGFGHGWSPVMKMDLRQLPGIL